MIGARRDHAGRVGSAAATRMVNFPDSRRASVDRATHPGHPAGADSTWPRLGYGSCWARGRHASRPPAPARFLGPGDRASRSAAATRLLSMKDDGTMADARAIEARQR